MADEPLDPILNQVTVPLPLSMIYASLTDPAQLSSWLCESAEVAREVGGPYVLNFREPVAFSSRGKVLAMTADLDLRFGWEAPPPFDRLLNAPQPKTQVYVRLQESPEGVDVTLEHEGWGSGEDWEEARSWHFHFWDERLARLKDYLIRAAYG